MKKLFTFLVLGMFFFLGAHNSFAGNSDAVSRKARQIYKYGERIPRINYVGDSVFETYLLIPYEDGHNAVRSGVGFEVFHQDIDSKELKIVASFIGNGKRFIKKALREKKSFTIMLSENKYGEHDGWKFVKENEVFLY